nr:uncharacterized protein LOC107378604 [Nothobranchius furzeri]
MLGSSKQTSPGSSRGSLWLSDRARCGLGSIDSAKNKKRAASITSGTPAQTPNKTKKPRRVYSSAGKRAKLDCDRQRQQTRINIVPAFEKWKMLRVSRYEKHALSKGPLTSTPYGPSTAVFAGPRRPSSVTAGESDRDDFQIAGVEPLKADQGVELLEESIKSMELKEDYLDEERANSLENSLTTAELESFQNRILMYAGKCFAFSYGVNEASKLLATLDYNHHSHRPVLVNSKGQVSHKRVYSKKSQRYSVHTVKETKDYGYIPELQTRILEKRLSSAGGLPKRRSIQPDDPRALGPLSTITPPPTAELVQTQQR